MEFVDARELGEVLATLDARGSEVTVLAGGTDVMVGVLRGDLAPPALLHVRRVAELAGIDQGDRTEVGALTTHLELCTDPRIRTDQPGLAEAAATVGGWQTQAVGTIAGNVVNASPAADLLPPLLVADARVTLESAAGQRELPLAEVVVGRKTTALAPNELVRRLSLERLPARAGETYVKLGRRGAMEVAVVGVAARLALGPDGTVADARVAVCSVAPVPFRCARAEAILTGTSLEPDAVGEAGRALQAEASPIGDARAEAAYRHRVLPALLARALAVCRTRAESEGEGTWN